MRADYDYYPLTIPGSPHEKRVDLWVGDDGVHLKIIEELKGVYTEIDAQDMEILVDAWLKRHPRVTGGG